MRTTQDIHVFQTMQRFGGSFARKLGEACELADDENLTRIKEAFPDLWQEYADLTVLAAKRDAERTR